MARPPRGRCCLQAKSPPTSWAGSSSSR